jgi:chemotaxis protein MotB
MQNSNLRGDQVTQVRGYADQMPRKKDAPLDASNRRISVIVQNLENKPTEPGKTNAGPATSSSPQDLSKKD